MHKKIQVTFAGRGGRSKPRKTERRLKRPLSVFTRPSIVASSHQATVTFTFTFRRPIILNRGISRSFNLATALFSVYQRPPSEHARPTHIMIVLTLREDRLLS